MTTYLNGRKLVTAPEGFNHTIKTRPFRGKAYEYIVVASNKLGRDISANEVVHHRDCNKSNNNPDNLLVLDSKRTHAILHSYNCNEGILKKLENGSFTINQDVIPLSTKRCYCCGNEVSNYNTSGLCHECASAIRRKADRPSKEQLASLVWDIPTSKIAIQYGVSDKAVQKWCDKYNISKPPRGYWSKNHKGPVAQQ